VKAAPTRTPHMISTPAAPGHATTRRKITEPRPESLQRRRAGVDRQRLQLFTLIYTQVHSIIKLCSRPNAADGITRHWCRVMLDGLRSPGLYSQVMTMTKPERM
jgi:hypothetical protein